jgi:hypothetical protein
MPEIPQPAWTISENPSDPGESIPLEGWHASFGRGGCDRAGGTVTADVARRVFQGMTLKAWIEGVCKWAGPISNNPLVYRGKAELQASGWRQKIERSTGRLPYQSRDVGLFQPRTGPPWNITETGVDFGPSSSNNQLQWLMDQTLTFLNTEHSTFIAAFPGAPGGISRIAFDWRSHSSFSSVVLKLFGATFPADTTTQIGSNIALTASSGSVDQSSSAGHDAVGIQLVATAGATLTTGYWLTLYNIRVNGIATSDTFTTSQIVTDILGKVGFDTSGVQSSGVNALPYDSTGNWWDALLYQAFLDDWAAPNIVPSDDGRERLGLYHPWGDRVHDISLENAEFDLNALELSNAVCVQYPHVGGFPAEVKVLPSDIGESDPLAGMDADNCLTISLQDPQPDDTLATSVGQSLLRRVLQPRYEGSGEIPELSDATIWDLRHGDHLNVADWGPLEARELPIDSVSLAAGRPARVNIYSPGSELGLADRVGLAKARQFQNPELPVIEAIEDALTEPGEVFHSHCHKHGPKNTHHREAKAKGKKAYKHKHQHSHEKIPQTRHRQEKDETTEPC